MSNKAKKKILLLSDDIRIPSGVGTMSQALVHGTIKKYDWVQIAGAVKHPDKGKVFDLSKQLNEKYGIDDAYCRLYPVNGYGNEEILRNIMHAEKPDAIIHFTDPRYWEYLYAMEHEVRQNIPIMYYNIWDDLPYPHWNESAYESCDLLMAISKQTYGINKNVCKRKPRKEGIDLTYVPHGIDHDLFTPVPKDDPAYTKFVKNISPDARDFVILFNSRNIHRKRVSDLILGYAKFCETLPAAQAQKCLLVLHTDPVDQHGTDLPALAEALCPYPVAFSHKKLSPEDLNLLYNFADVVACPSSAEGFGLSHMEAVMSGTPTIATVVGGLQDQMGFKIMEYGEVRELLVEDFTPETPSNSTGKISKEAGEWTYPLWPQINLQGSPLTPYIYDSRPNILNITDGLKYWYDMDKKERKNRGLIGREWAIKNGFTNKQMCIEFSNSIDTCFNNFEPRGRYTIIDSDTPKPKYDTGILI